MLYDELLRPSAGLQNVRPERAKRSTSNGLEVTTLHYNSLNMTASSTAFAHHDRDTATGFERSLRETRRSSLNVQDDPTVLAA